MAAYLRYWCTIKLYISSHTPFQSNPANSKPCFLDSISSPASNPYIESSHFPLEGYSLSSRHQSSAFSASAGRHRALEALRILPRSFPHLPGLRWKSFHRRWIRRIPRWSRRPGAGRVRWMNCPPLHLVQGAESFPFLGSLEAAFASPGRTGAVASFGQT